MLVGAAEAPRRRRPRHLRHLLRPIPCRPTPEQLELVEAYASIVALGLDNVRRKAELAASYEAAVLALTSALDVRDDYTGSHSTATSRLVREVCVAARARRA